MTSVAPSLVVLTGASGSGKTTIAKRIEQTNPEITVLRFDSIGVPTSEVMATFGTGHNPGGAWQRAMTLTWMEQITPILQSGHPVLFEGQMRIAFIQEGLAAQQITHARIYCVECSDEVRTARLTHDRQQPELADEGMMGWSRYLHAEAIAAGCEILDTTELSLNQSTAKVLLYLKN